jgi:Tol biopolymer transport system component
LVKTSRDVSWVRPSPRGDLLAYSSHQPPPSDPSLESLFVLSVDTGAENEIAKALFMEFAWSPDGRALAFVSPERDLWVSDANTEDRKRIARGVLGMVGENSWTRRGEILFYRADRKIRGIKPDGTGERVALNLGQLLWTISAQTRGR